MLGLDMLGLLWMEHGDCQSLVDLTGVLMTFIMHCDNRWKHMMMSTGHGAVKLLGGQVTRFVNVRTPIYD